MGSNNFRHFETCQISTKSGPLDPLFIAEIFLRIQKTAQIIFNKYVQPTASACFYGLVLALKIVK